MVVRSHKEVENKASEKDHDKLERLKIMESDLEIEKENDPIPSPVVYDSIITYKPRIPYPQDLDEPFPSKKDK